MKKIILSAVLLASVSVAQAQTGAFAKAARNVKATPNFQKADSVTQGEPKKLAVVMTAQKSISDNAITSPDLSDFTKALAQTNVKNTLSTAGPFTVFAPTNTAFEAVPDAAKFLSADNTNALRKTLFHHVVTGKWTSANLQDAINKGNGRTVLRTMTAQNLTVSKKDNQFVISDEQGHQAVVVLPDQEQKNGIVHVVSAVLMPK
ncbi:fasciclin domain-containing protein [Siphonobacter sp. SORGH_AS_1065]|uniref:fasciclin domain-containing protein n=1 Tax=Siphonobacter sp. SORGH_AS_1065 TaxID=3041795 RepID=UPI002789D315|nr:fasciclin domain-containing protein [Siphonobacter sp. SORGH_AS_1065]MDQ1088867.1 putative surface protein with fasciclin (FAS1) repeats [Siphonobacter sp. SORGH_AS_1065]